MNVTVDQFLTTTQTDSILEYCKNKLILSDGKLSQSDNSNVRKSKVAFTKLNHFEFLIAGLIKEINRYYKFDGYQIDNEYTFQFSEYQIGEYYDWHIDSGNTVNAKRRISLVILLNDDYSGGDLVLNLSGAEEVMDKKTGNLFLFDSTILHKVTPVESGVKYSLVAWVGLKENEGHKKSLI